MIHIIISTNFDEKLASMSMSYNDVTQRRNKSATMEIEVNVRK